MEKWQRNSMKASEPLPTADDDFNDAFKPGWVDTEDVAPAPYSMGYYLCRPTGLREHLYQPITKKSSEWCAWLSKRRRHTEM